MTNMSRRSFLQRGGVAAGGVAALVALPAALDAAGGVLRPSGEVVVPKVEVVGEQVLDTVPGLGDIRLGGWAPMSWAITTGVGDATRMNIELIWVGEREEYYDHWC